MQRFCVRHTYRGSSRAHRLILARHSLDRDAHQLVVDEYDGCPQCWRDTCLAAVDAANSLLVSSAGSLPELDGHGNASAPTITWLLGRIGSLLACEQRDRRDLHES